MKGLQKYTQTKTQARLSNLPRDSSQHELINDEEQSIVLSTRQTVFILDGAVAILASTLPLWFDYLFIAPQVAALWALLLVVILKSSRKTDFDRLTLDEYFLWHLPSSVFGSFRFYHRVSATSASPKTAILAVDNALSIGLYLTATATVFMFDYASSHGIGSALVSMLGEGPTEVLFTALCYAMAFSSAYGFFLKLALNRKLG
ncbi:hypothetical protein [Chitinilyticum piscinae]|uniref:Uncharacterized protein n=1 Tax=Chitinilyticum piscinae TaxID=2866724 RepID=A0A8J7FL31_9NEIS|nr:hypothetical protein [Chitinilyticum piscinae]MBE9610037.1 hypothetical protein [Chitinilyticum piscinae]